MKRTAHLVTLIGFLAVIFGFTLAFWILPDQSFSQEENRSLQRLPRFSLERLASGEFSSQINEYFADQFPLRDALIGIKGGVELALGKGENNGVLLGKDGQIAKRMFSVFGADGDHGGELDRCYDDHLIKAIVGINRIGESSRVPVDVLLTGRTVDVATSAFSYPQDYSDAMLKIIRTQISSKVNYLDTVPMYRQRYEAGEEVYFKTDHHWTQLGAYYAYVELMKSYGMEDAIIPIERYERRQYEGIEFYGTTWSASGMKHVAPDSFELWYLGNEQDFTVTADGKEFTGFYNLDFLAKKDKYSTFLDGTHDVVTVKKNTDEARQTLVLFKDSFANALVPFLAQHFDLVLLNLSSTRTDYTDITAYASQYGADRILIVYTVGNVISTDKLERLR